MTRIGMAAFALLLLPCAAMAQGDKNEKVAQGGQTLYCDAASTHPACNQCRAEVDKIPHGTGARGPAWRQCLSQLGYGN